MEREERRGEKKMGERKEGKESKYKFRLIFVSFKELQNSANTCDSSRSFGASFLRISPVWAGESERCPKSYQENIRTMGARFHTHSPTPCPSTQPGLRLGS